VSEAKPQSEAEDGGRAAPEPDVLLRRLLKLSNLIGRPFFSHFAEPFDLTRNDIRVLLTLAEMSEAAAHEVCRVTGMHPMNVSRSVARLRRQGRITERSDPSNRRRKILTPTAVGWDLNARLKPHVAVTAEFLFASLSELEAEFLNRLVGRLVERLEAVDLNSRDLLDADVLAKEISVDVEASADGDKAARARRKAKRAISAGRRAPPRQAG